MLLYRRVNGAVRIGHDGTVRANCSICLRVHTGFTVHPSLASTLAKFMMMSFCTVPKLSMHPVSSDESNASLNVLRRTFVSSFSRLRFCSVASSKMAPNDETSKKYFVSWSCATAASRVLLRLFFRAFAAGNTRLLPSVFTCNSCRVGGLACTCIRTRGVCFLAPCIKACTISSKTRTGARALCTIN